ncbi:uncharacterized protein LOC123315062 [Coccinella septempunctata]|uniref:uncharacterized protein LOC123315062 n=1 Tax=Coccinella septempunctata TaxID=41139 RepID=UPI001D08E43C|nr:uncharacterized protein LOC123315062 [Coccinella septempunctata]XP_044756553.1 uncharacterized protein LOC123315062 [Coccinella septempunctata]XP_044756554.1 uncharacterized protein LOC123315062 [Coccinella septempunctata]
MQIVQHRLRAFIAVLGLAFVLHPVQCQIHYDNHTAESRNGRRVGRSIRSRHNNLNNDEDWFDSLYKQNIPLISPGKLLTPRENQQLIRQETRNRTTVDCCPSVLEMIEPEGGKNQDDQYVELYRDGDHRQRFYELSCHKDIKNKPCRFMDKKIHEHSRCVQKYSYTYALVKDTGRHHHHQKISNKNFPTFPAKGPEEVRWTLDYIRVRSGCSCVVTSNKQKRKQKHKRIKHDEET